MSHGGNVPPTVPEVVAIAASRDGSIYIPKYSWLIYLESGIANSAIISRSDPKEKVVIPDAGTTVMGETATRLASPHQPIGKLESATGWVTIVRADGTIVRGNPGDFVFRGDVVRTGSESEAVIKLLEGNNFCISDVTMASLH